MSLIEEENWKDKLTMEELQIKCDYYSAKIKEVEKCFSNFFQTVKQDEWWHWLLKEFDVSNF